MKKPGKLEKPVKTGKLHKDVIAEKPHKLALVEGGEKMDGVHRGPQPLVNAKAAGVDPSTPAPSNSCASCGAVAESGLAVVYHKPGCKAYALHNAQPGQSQAAVAAR